MKRILFLVLLLNVANSFAMGGHKVDINKAIDNAIIRYGLQTEPQLKSYFQAAGISYPPKEIAFLAFKQERHIELWAKDDETPWKMIHEYPLTAFSGRLGPKLRERDYQIPEGVYHLTTFNPFSSMHLSMMINYPNDFDRMQAIKDGRRQLGGDIFLHGKTLSVGCLAVGDRAIDQLFLLVRRVGLNKSKVIIAPNDLRVAKPATSSFAQPRWLPELYHHIRIALNEFPVTKHYSKGIKA